MIGVVCSSAEGPVVLEFFELFKTPWEFYRAGQNYSVILCSGRAELPPRLTQTPPVVLIYSAEKTAFDDRHGIQVEAAPEGTYVSLLGSQVRIHGKSATVCAPAAVTTEAIHSHYVAGRGFVRIGYNLFEEVEALLTKGQPPADAHVPALDLHVSLLRTLIRESGETVVEIPPAPEGHPFTACLTHDLDHASVRRHKWDATIGGFLFRATFGSIANLIRGRLNLSGVLTNWAAAIRLPFCQLGLVEDFWSGFDRYLEIEGGRPSTFFVIPFENRPGSRPVSGDAPTARGSRYDVSHIASKLPVLQAAGCEIGLHGINAWADSSKGMEESQRISTFSGRVVSGVRMHWLYRDERTPAVLEQAEFSYDSTTGYNETIGYRAGTTQVFKPLGVKRLLELPMHVMDTAMFYPKYLNLSLKEARERIRPILDHAARFGGTFTVNWHDRSIAPERLWGGFYRDLLGDLTQRNAWFCTADQAVFWFRKRRSVIFERDGDDGFLVRVPSDSSTVNVPGMRLRVHGVGAGADYTETGFSTGMRVRIRSDRTAEIRERS